MLQTQIVDASNALPENLVSSKEVEERIRNSGWSYTSFPKGIVEKTSWVINRRYTADNEYPSTLASKACLNIISRNSRRIDLLIFASASQDLIEPATANIIQANTWLTCPTLDIKNACNSVLSALDMADWLIRSWKYENILVCSWETPSKSIRWKLNSKEDFLKSFSWYTLWDAWAALLLSATNDETKWIRFQHFETQGNLWDSITIMGWWAMYPRDADKTYFSSDATKLKSYFENAWWIPFQKGFEATWWKMDDVKKVFIHQVSSSIYKRFMEITWVPKDKVSFILDEYGNTASCWIPLAFSQAKERWEIEDGDKVIFVCYAAWLAYGILFIQI
ncbi:MAG: hypothetical protein ACD_2C00152G0006 [uncultured bacterium (gcode 4)]|uniref:Uncharacterized protein n=1 Tax=uncultured bacterium (gcode 4) TaxID=1234023 RepID=K2G5J5_9BACT|nr:MAG: hypothetical protein ACD_2C00152G0006 [uncultured bacterium (gcode 4)]